MHAHTHTPTPWKMWTTTAPHAPVIIYAGDVKPRLKANGYPEYAPNSFIAEVSTFHGEHGDDDANAAFIIRACDVHDELVELLRECGDEFQTHFGEDFLETDLAKRLASAIRKARGEAYGSWEAPTLSKLAAKIVDYYSDGDSRLPEVTNVVAHHAYGEDELSQACLDQFNKNLANEFDAALIRLQCEIAHVREVSSPYLTGRI